MVVLVESVDREGYAYGRTERGREVVIFAAGRRMAQLARLVAAQVEPVRVNASRAAVMFQDGAR